MVIEGTSAFSVESKSHRIAPTEDRLLAFVFDLVLFSPVVSLAMSQVLKQMEMVQTVAPQSIEFTVLVVVLLVFSAILVLLTQTLFLFTLQATPGKYFFKMRVVAYEPTEGQTRLTFTQAFLRSLFWNLEFCMLGFPWLEAFSAPKRRLLHDRVSNTVVVTQKMYVDRGPNILEAHFMRQLFLFSAFAACGLLVFIGGHYYRAALQSNFHRSELVSSDFFCEQVSMTVKSDENRLDKALALYMAGEIDEDCLSAEAEFALWWPSHEDKDWAYLAKGILRKSDPELAQSYWLKACSEKAEGPACGIAKYEAEPRDSKIPDGTITSQILSVIQQFEKAQYVKAERSFVDLAKGNGFERFSGQGLVKSFWAQDKIERAQGAFASVVHQLDPASRVELAAWICHEELDNSCSSKAIEACEILKEEDKVTGDSFVALALIREKECRQSETVDYRQFHSLFEERADVLQFVKAIAKESKLTHQQRMTALEDLSFRKNSVRPSFLRLMAIQEWVGQATPNSDFKLVSKFLKEKKVRDLSWIKIYKKTIAALVKNKASKELGEIAMLPNSDLVRRYNLLGLQSDAKQVIAQKAQMQDRIPASQKTTGQESQ
jgi:uncharacterized RDD family membrane protein YckC